MDSFITPILCAKHDWYIRFVPTGDIIRKVVR